MKKKNITIEDLARMVKIGFEETAKRKEVNSRFNEVDSRFNTVENRLDKIEKLILADHRKRIERLEFEVKELKDLFAL